MHVTYFVITGTVGIADEVPRDVSGEARLLLQKSLQQKLVFCCPAKGGGEMTIRNFSQNQSHYVWNDW